MMHDPERPFDFGFIGDVHGQHRRVRPRPEPLGNDAFEKACVKIYLSHHVSELNDLSKTIQYAWQVGSDIYNSRKQNGPTPSE